MIDSPVLLLALLAAIVAVPLLLKRQRAAAPDGIRVLGRTALSKNAVVAVIVAGDRRLLVGASDRGVHLLADLDLDGAAASDDPSITMTSLPALERTDTPERLPIEVNDAVDAPSLAAIGAPTAGPGIGLLDRLRAMTVRTPVRGRPPHVPPRR